MINDVKAFEVSKNIPIVASFSSNDEATSLRKEKNGCLRRFWFSESMLAIWKRAMFTEKGFHSHLKKSL